MALFLGFKFSRLKLVMYGTAVVGPLGKNRNIIHKSDYVKKMDSIYFSKAGALYEIIFDISYRTRYSLELCTVAVGPLGGNRDTPYKWLCW